MRMNASANNSRRSGFTLIELMVVMVLLSFVVGGLVKVIAGQQRFYRSAGDLMESRGQIRQAVSLLPSDLRGMSTVGGDVLAASDVSIDFRATIGSSAVCSATANSLTFPPQVLASGQTISAGRTTAAAGDFVAVYDDGPTTGRTDDQWRIYTITGVTQTVGACVAPFVSAADLLRASSVVSVAQVVSAGILQGAPVRFLRRITYSLYTAADGKAYLGYVECPGGGCSTIQPVSGPYRSFVSTSNAANGLQIQYFNTTDVEISGAQLAVPANLATIARLRISVRGQTANAMAVPGMPAAPKQDSLTVHVGVRNRQ